MKVTNKERRYGDLLHHLLLSNTCQMIAELQPVINQFQSSNFASAQENRIWQCVGNICESSQEERFTELRGR